MRFSQMFVHDVSSVEIGPNSCGNGIDIQIGAADCGLKITVFSKNRTVNGAGLNLIGELDKEMILAWLRENLSA